MSFILDALKKSESDRQRQSGPALFEVKVAPPKSGFPVWAIAIVALLVVNMIIVGWMLMRRASHGEDTAATNSPPASTNMTAGAAPPTGTGAPQSSPSAGNMTGPPAAPPFNGASGGNMSANSMPGANAPGSMSAANGPPGSMSAGSTAPASGGLAPGNGESPGGGMSAGNVISPTGTTSPSGSMSPAGGQSGSGSAGSRGQSAPPSNQQGMGASQGRMSDRDQNEPTLAGSAREAGGANEGGGSNTEPGNPDDYAPAADAGSPLFKGHVKRGTESGLQLYQDAAVASGGNLPELRLDLHVYATQPHDRFALINMHRVHEGDTLQGGVRVESITPDGVVMSHNGSRFLLPRE
jgi:general secretion pathway protein B